MKNWDEGTFTTIDGETYNNIEYFRPEDFVQEERNGKVVSEFVKHTGLLRVAKDLFKISDRQVTVPEVPRKDNGLCAVAKVRYEVTSKKDGETYSFESSADARDGNYDSAYQTAMAETRASGRALRFLLGVDFCTNEEISKSNNKSSRLNYGADESRTISSAALAVIKTKFVKGKGISEVKIKELLGMDKDDVLQLESLTVSQGAQLIQNLNKLK